MEVDYDSTLGATYIGVTITACLYGISTLHGYTYWNQQTQDHTITRISMAVLWLADTAKLVCAAHIGYRLLITGYEDDPAAMFYSTWSMKMELLLTALIIFVAQVFTAYHAWKSAKRINVLWATPRVIRIIGIIAVRPQRPPVTCFTSSPNLIMAIIYYPWIIGYICIFTVSIRHDFVIISVDLLGHTRDGKTSVGSEHMAGLCGLW
ncbi:hypothetical protein ACGC1H_000262 [Rhizoctonia solani]